LNEPARNSLENRTERVHAGSVVLLAILLAAAWLLWSGMFKPLLLLLGAFSCGLVLLIAYRMRLFDRGVFQLRFMGRLLRFWGWLGREVVRSSLDVTRAVLNPRLPINPTVAEFDAHCEHPVDRAILGNSITLTPGTLTLSIDGQRFLVHALTEQGAQDLLTGEMDRRISELRNR
jgi:multicomponent Na+:H+ antiporter subunit E